MTVNFTAKDWKDAPPGWRLGDPLPPGATPVDAAALKDLETRTRAALLSLDSRIAALEGGSVVAPSSALSLPRVAWNGGPDYYTVAKTGPQMAKAEASGWSSKSFFPIGTWSVKVDDPAYAAAYASIGINTALTTEGPFGGQPISNITNSLFVFAVPSNPATGFTGWSPAAIGNDPKVVAWFPGDEFDQGLAGFVGADNEDGWLAAMQQIVNPLKALNDGRFIFTNFGNGGSTLSPSQWAPNTRDEMEAMVDGFCVDKYAYTSPVSRYAIESWAPNWPGYPTNNNASQRSGTYGFLTRQARLLSQPFASKPVMPFIETKLPYIDEAGMRIITYDEIEGAVFSALANEARGVAYFQMNGFYEVDLGGGNFGDNPRAPTVDPNTGAAPSRAAYSLLNVAQFNGSPDPGLIARVTQINSRVTALAPVLNTQSYAWSFGAGAAGLDTMLKELNGFAYIFASVGAAGIVGAKTFTLPAEVKGTSVEVLNESRSIPVSGGAFTDTFAAEYSHHVYRIAV